MINYYYSDSPTDDWSRYCHDHEKMYCHHCSEIKDEKHMYDHEQCQNCFDENFEELKELIIKTI